MASAPDELAERNALVRARLGREPEHALPDHVALHLLGAAADAGPPLVHELLLPEAAVWRLPVQQHPTGALERESKVAVQRHILRDGELQDRRLGTHRAAVAPTRLRRLPQ